MHRFIAALLFSVCLFSRVDAFQIDLPRGYLEKRNEMWRREALTIWRELDRAEIEWVIREFVRAHPQIDGVDLAPSVSSLTWSYDDQRFISCGSWSVTLLSWEATYPKLSRLKWEEASMLISVAYDWRTKTLGGEGNGEIRLILDIARSGPFFGRKTLKCRLRDFDYGEVYINLPFGGIELKKDGQPGATDNPDDAQRLREDH